MKCRTVPLLNKLDHDPLEDDDEWDCPPTSVVGDDTVLDEGVDGLSFRFFKLK